MKTPYLDLMINELVSYSARRSLTISEQQKLNELQAIKKILKETKNENN